MRREQRAANVRRMISRPPNVEVVIDELILRGFPASERYAIGEALSSELERLFVENGSQHINASRPHLPALDAGKINVAATSQPGVIGIQVAQAVYGGLNGSDRRRA